jgi:hypothetical protein
MDDAAHEFDLETMFKDLVQDNPGWESVAIRDLLAAALAANLSAEWLARRRSSPRASASG